MQNNNANQHALFQAIREVHVMYVTQQIALFDFLLDKFGPELTTAIEEAHGEYAAKQYLQKAGDSRTIDDLITLLWEPLRKLGYEFTVKKNDEGTQITCTACPYAKLYKGLGGEKWGYNLYCAIDACLTARFNPDIGFKRTKTLMEGDECCDHFYFIKK